MLTHGGFDLEIFSHILYFCLLTLGSFHCSIIINYNLKEFLILESCISGLELC